MKPIMVILSWILIGNITMFSIYKQQNRPIFLSHIAAASFGGYVLPLVAGIVFLEDIIDNKCVYNCK